MARRKRNSISNGSEDNLIAGNQNPTASQGERQSIYFPKDIADEIKAEALRQDRSISWIMQKAWKIAKPKMKQLPSANELESEFTPPRKERK